MHSKQVVCFVGCYTNNNDKFGIYSIGISPKTGLKILDKFEANNVSYFAHSHPYLYAISEGASPQNLWRFRIESESSRLTEPHKIELSEDGACFLHIVQVSEAARRLAVAFYDSGVVQFFKDVDGIISPGPKHKFTDFSNHIPSRQEKPHIHCVNIDETTNILRILDSIQTQPGSGPRHVIQHSTYPLLFVLNELDNSLYVYKVENDLKFRFMETHSTLVNSNTDYNVESDIQNAAHLNVSACGQFVLCSNRGRLNNIVVFQVLNLPDKILRIQNVAGSCGNFPRYFALHGNTIIIANQLSRNVVQLKFEDGCIKEKLSEITLPEQPVALHICNA